MRSKAKATAVFRAMQGSKVYCDADLVGRGHHLCGNKAKWLASMKAGNGLNRKQEMKLCTLHANRYLKANRINTLPGRFKALPIMTEL